MGGLVSIVSQCLECESASRRFQPGEGPIVKPMDRFTARQITDTGALEQRSEWFLYYIILYSQTQFYSKSSNIYTICIQNSYTKYLSLFSPYLSLIFRCRVAILTLNKFTKYLPLRLLLFNCRREDLHRHCYICVFMG